MAMDFPASPALNDKFTGGDKAYIFNGEAWNIEGSGGATSPPAPIDAYTKAESDTKFVDAAGDTMTGGLSFGSTDAAAANNLTRHIALYGTEIGFSVTGGNKLNYRVADANDTHAFGYDTTDVLTIAGGNHASAITAKVAATFERGATFAGMSYFIGATFTDNYPINWLTTYNADYPSPVQWSVFLAKTKDNYFLWEIQAISGSGPLSGGNTTGAFRVNVGNKTSGKLTAFETLRDTNPVDLSVQGDVLARGVQLTSDASLKHDIRDFDRAQTDAIFATLKPKRYFWSDLKIKQEDGEIVTVPCTDQREQYGFIADEIHADIVQGVEGEKSYDLAAVVALLVAKLKDVEEELQALKVQPKR